MGKRLRVFCGECRFWEKRDPPVPGEAWGQCRRWAPRPVVHDGAALPEGRDYAFWPLTDAKDTCAEGAPGRG
jgi:hypothetical protein